MEERGASVTSHGGRKKKVSAVSYKSEGRGSLIGMPVHLPIIACQSKPEERTSYHTIIRSPRTYGQINTSRPSLISLLQ